jgi:hypothetical protein
LADFGLKNGQSSDRHDVLSKPIRPIACLKGTAGWTAPQSVFALSAPFQPTTSLGMDVGGQGVEHSQTAFRKAKGSHLVASS